MPSPVVPLAYLFCAAALDKASTPAAVDAPVTDVTVFSDRARVTRTASVSVDGAARFSLPVLPPGIDPGSVRLESKEPGVTIEKVDVSNVEADAFPTALARTVLEALETVDADLAKLRRDRRVQADNEDMVGGLVPQLPQAEGTRPAPRLDGKGWPGVLTFARTAKEKAAARVRDLDEKIRVLSDRRALLVDKASQLGNLGRRPGFQVVATLHGQGKASLRLTYMANAARWVPAWDIGLRADGREVDVLLGGMVSQETGEDWTQAALTLSTAVPGTATVLPKLATWKIGERERFIPTPAPVRDPGVVPPPAAVPLRARADDEDDRLRQTLLARAAQPEDGDGQDQGGVATRGKGANREQAERQQQANLRAQMEAERQQRMEMQRRRRAALPAPAPPPAPMSGPRGGAAPSAMAPMAREAQPEPMAEAESRAAYEEDSAPSRPSMTVSSGMRKMRSSDSSGGGAPSQSFGIAPPPGHVAPTWGAETPAGLAGGYDLAFRSAARETVGSGKGLRRVALLGHRWPVTLERKIYPALSTDAYLTAEIRNPSGQALPGGPARLSVGGDPAGTAQLRAVAPGESFTLPLGLDRALKPVRNVQVAQREKGLISKDEINDYTVTIELSNPGRAPIAVRLFDQIPVTDDKDLEITLGQVSPAIARMDKVKGELEWSVQVPPGGKSVVRWSYSLKRPKGYLLHQ